MLITESAVDDGFIAANREAAPIVIADSNMIFIMESSEPITFISENRR